MQTGFGVSVLSHCTKLQQKWGLNSYLKEQADMKCLETFVNKDNKEGLALQDMHWRRKGQPTPVFLPGESQGWGSLVGCRLWGRTE